MMRTKILIDCDPGHDDAVAILYAAKHLDLVGVTTCHGNNTISNVTRNALSVLTLGGIDVPLAQGCADPLIGRKTLVAKAHGKTGLDGTDLPTPDRSPVAVHAVDFLIDMARTHRDELVLAVIGPATNVALALKKEPRFASWLREITVMGGSTGLGNITPVASYNTWCDPEAACEMFACGAPIRMVGYNVSSVTGTNEADIARLLAGGKVARHVGELLDFYRDRQRYLLGPGYDIAPMADVCAIVPYVRDGLIEYRHCHVGVELNGQLTRGMTVCDLRTLTVEGRAERGVGEANVRVAIRSEARALIDHVMETLLDYP
jgi:inosine-uridine nucleoside N-ribohydrolase